MIELELTNAEARKAVKAFRATKDSALHQLANLLDASLERVRPKQPWRKVISTKQGLFFTRYETLECGHTIQIVGSKNYDPPVAKKRRCKKCEAEQ